MYHLEGQPSNCDTGNSLREWGFTARNLFTGRPSGGPRLRAQS
jgi:hypothetical protein